MDDMKEALKPQPLKKPMDKSQCGSDVAALNSLLGLLNDPRITGASVPKGEKVTADVALDKTGATMLPTDPVITTKPLKVPVQPVAPTTLPVMQPHPRNTSKIFYTGLIGVGKDFVCEQTGAKIFGFSEPLYHMAEYFFGVPVNAKEGKQLPGVRAFLQAVGQWGRGEISEQYPLTPARACFVSMIRSLGEAARFDSEYEVDWTTYGRNKDIWLNATNARVEKFLSQNPETKVAITNVRFQNEFKRLRELGWEHVHILCSPETRVKRIPVGSGSKDMSEQLAVFLNSDVTRIISAQPKGAKLNCVWNDSVPAPSTRLYSTSEFLSRFQKTEVENSICTGE